jgi:hypothetical protein
VCWGFAGGRRVLVGLGLAHSGVRFVGVAGGEEGKDLGKEGWQVGWSV